MVVTVSYPATDIQCTPECKWSVLSRDQHDQYDFVMWQPRPITLEQHGKISSVCALSRVCIYHGMYCTEARGLRSINAMHPERTWYNYFSGGFRIFRRGYIKILGRHAHFRSKPRLLSYLIEWERSDQRSVHNTNKKNEQETKGDWSLQHNSNLLR